MINYSELNKKTMEIYNRNRKNLELRKELYNERINKINMQEKLKLSEKSKNNSLQNRLRFCNNK